jgi:hypothetical protein
MDVVYICRTGENEELRYSLRSLVNINHDNVFVVGGKPQWYEGNHIRVEYTGTKYTHARANLEAVIKNQRISNNFILMNDDFYILEPIGDLGVYNQGLLKDKMETYLNFAPRSTYTKMIVDTYDFLLEQGYQKPLCYELHVPMVMNKVLLKKAMATRKLWRSVYGNFNNLGGIKMPDVKVYNEKGLENIKHDYLNSSQPFLSSQDNTFRELKDALLHRLFQEKSQYEK